MKIAIASQGNTLDSSIDPRFGRCSYYIIYETESKSFEIVPNPYKANEDSAGKSAVQLMTSRGVQKIVAGEFGLKIKGLLDSLNIQLIIMKNNNRKVQEIIELLEHSNR